MVSEAPNTILIEDSFGNGKTKICEVVELVKKGQVYPSARHGYKEVYSADIDNLESGKVVPMSEDYLKEQENIKKKWDTKKIKITKDYKKSLSTQDRY